MACERVACYQGIATLFACHPLMGPPIISNSWGEEESQPLHLLHSNLIMDCRFRRRAVSINIKILPIMKLAVCFIHSKARPSSFIVDLTHEQWWEFYRLDSRYEQKKWMMHFLNKEFLSVANALCWIPLDLQSILTINDNVIVYSNPNFH